MVPATGRKPAADMVHPARGVCGLSPRQFFPGWLELCYDEDQLGPVMGMDKYSTLTLYLTYVLTNRSSMNLAGLRKGFQSLSVGCHTEPPRRFLKFRIYSGGRTPADGQ